MNILIIDDEPGLRQTVSLILADEGYEVTTASDGEEGLAKALEGQPDIIVCDIRMPRLTGLEFLDKYKEANGTAMVIVMTAYGGMEMAIQAMKRGAYDYIPKPFSPDQLVLTLKKAEERESLRREVSRLREEVSIERRYRQIVAKAPAMTKALEVAAKVAKHPSPVMITGESGTGKELVARLIHDESDRARGAFIPVNCGAIPENLLESELFGYVKGAFTGADQSRPGMFQAADSGTLFLDEVGEMPLQLQVKLLRALAEKTVVRVGDSRPEPVDIRVVAATNRNLEQETVAGRFREDLYYRLNVIALTLPPLRERGEDVPVIARYFVQKYAAEYGAKAKGLT